MPHLDEGTIHAWLDGALTPEEAAAVESHIASCPECAAKVAEARGFVAGASRILTALDDVPRGVVPAARPARRINQTFLRAAAAVLVVATGGLLVIRGRESVPTVASVATDRVADTVTHPMKSVASEAAPVVAPSTQLPSLASDAASSRVSANNITSANSAAKRRAISPTQSPTTVASGGIASGVAGGTATTAPALAPSPPPAVTVAPMLEQRVARRDTTKMDFTLVPDVNRLQAVVTTGVTGATETTKALNREEPRLKLVREEKIPGGKRTIYEITPGKNVALVEIDTSSRAAAVVMSQPTMATRVAPMSLPTSASSTSAQLRRTDSAGVQWELQSAPSIRWTDRAGKIVILSGFFSYEELQRIRQRIERERLQLQPQLH